jgi:dTDP-4-dehydrorhamnose reductase
MRMVVVGARGQLGAAIVHECRNTHEVVPLGHSDLDVTDDRAVAAEMARIAPAAIVNCVAFNDVDGAEDRPVDAFTVNAFAVRALARAAADHDAILVHYSTDFVFDGTATTPYVEDDQPNPRSVYAASKLVGEWFADDARRAYVLRVESLFGRAPGAGPAKGSVVGLLNNLRTGHEARAFTDRVVSPTYIIDAARATRQLIEGGAPYGLYHCVNSECCTWFDFACELARQLGVPPLVTPVAMTDVPLKAHRPQFCALSNRKLASVGITMPRWQDAVAQYLSGPT